MRSMTVPAALVALAGGLILALLVGLDLGNLDVRPRV